MFEHHRKSPWFAEKYSPAQEFQNLRWRVRKEGWKGRINSFLHDLEAGKFDPDLSEPEPVSPSKDIPPNVENIQPDISNTAAPVDEIKNTAGNDDMQFHMDTEEDVGDPEASRADANDKLSTDTKRLNRGEEISVMPEGNQVMIRTIPPDIGRVKLEEVCISFFPCHIGPNVHQSCGKLPGFMYLALGDPLQKRNYYRAGWLRFKDD